MSYGIYTENGRQTMLVNFGKLGTGANTLTFDPAFLTTVNQRLGAQITETFARLASAAGEQAAALQQEIAMYQNTLRLYNNPSSVYGFILSVPTYISNDQAESVTNKAGFSYGAVTLPDAEYTVRYDQHASITGSVKNGDFVIKKIDAASSARVSGAVSDAASFGALTGLTGTTVQIFQKGETQPLTFTKGSDGIYTLSAAEGASADIAVVVKGTTVRGLPVTGTYTLREAGAPTGYLLDGDIDFTVNGGSVAYFALADLSKPVMITATKIWADDNNSAKTRPQSVTFQLMKTVNDKTTAAGEAVILTKADTANGDENTWKHVFGSLPSYENGQEITYTVEETSALPEGYTAVMNGMTVTNTYTPAAPVTPVNPSTPTDPVTPPTPVEPSNPSTPANPTRPTNPTNPTNPGNSGRHETTATTTPNGNTVTINAPGVALGALPVAGSPFTGDPLLLWITIGAISAAGLAVLILPRMLRSHKADSQK